MRTRLGIMGGMFDPVHNAHIAAARFALSQLELDKLHLVPCHVPNHRAMASSSPQHRVAMLELATASDPRMLIDSIEINSDRTSYSVDTIRSIRQAHPHCDVVFIAGTDAFNSFTQWHKWEDILDLCHLFIVPRDSASIADSIRIAVNLAEREVTTAQDMFQTEAGTIWIAEDFRVDMSSTDVRDAIRQHQDLTTLLDTRVVEYINQHNLYN